MITRILLSFNDHHNINYHWFGKTSKACSYFDERGDKLWIFCEEHHEKIYKTVYFIWLERPSSLHGGIEMRN